MHEFLLYRANMHDQQDRDVNSGPDSVSSVGIDKSLAGVSKFYLQSTTVQEPKELKTMQ